MDIEAIVGAELSAAGLRALADPPGDASDAWVRVTLIDSPQDNTETDHLVGYYLQCDCYAGDGNARSEAKTIADTARITLRGLAGKTLSGAVVSGVRVNGFSRIPDETFEPARQRYIVTATVWAHQ